MNDNDTLKCRLCAELLCHENEDSLFNQNNVIYLELIYKYISIQVAQNDILPTYICEGCKQILKSFHEYVLKCKVIQDDLKNFVEGTKLKEECFVKVEIKNEVEVSTDFEGYIKFEADDSQDDDFCNEDSLPLIESVRNLRLKNSGNKASKSQQIPTKSKLKIKKEKNKFKKKPKESKRTKQKKEKVIYEDKEDNIERDCFKRSGVSINSHPFFNFICHVCKLDCKNYNDLTSHVSSSHSETAYIMCICSQELRSRQSLFRHLMKHVDGFGIKCNVCTRKFRSQYFYDKHMKTHEKEYSCPHCPKKFPSIEGIKSHERVHIPAEVRAKHPCDLCDMVFLSKYSVISHKKAIHEKVKSFICDECGKSFVLAAALAAHKAVHQKDAPVSCPQCPKKFKNKIRLRRHLDYHKGVSYKCPECSALFTSKRTLTEHFYIHRDVYRYVCGYCDKKFKWKSSFTSHVNNHTGATPYKCDWCPKTFSDGPNCRIHKKRKHPVELAALDAKKAKENPKVQRSDVPIIRDVTIKEPTIEDAIIFPAVKKKSNENDNSA